jgi:hypothetical protein
MKSHTVYLWFNAEGRRHGVNISEGVSQRVRAADIQPLT